jgi:hypothetical protein
MMSSKKMKDNTMTKGKYFGQVAPVCLCDQPYSMRAKALMSLFLHTWKKLICAGE